MALKSAARFLCLALTVMFTPILPATASGIDVDAAQALARKSGCFNCHAIDKTKAGPAYHDIALKYHGKPDAEGRLIAHITTGAKSKTPDGRETEHIIVKSTDPAEIKNLVDWILER